MAIDVQQEMARRVTNALTDLRHELAGEGLGVEFTIKETANGLTVVVSAVKGGKIEPGSNVAIDDDGPETIVLPSKKAKGG